MPAVRGLNYVYCKGKGMEGRGVNVTYCTSALKHSGTQIRQVGILQPVARGHVSFFVINITAIMDRARQRRKDLVKNTNIHHL
jgi:hypothetical protein